MKTEKGEHNITKIEWLNVVHFIFVIWVCIKSVLVKVCPNQEIQQIQTKGWSIGCNGQGFVPKGACFPSSVLIPLRNSGYWQIDKCNEPYERGVNDSTKTQLCMYSYS